jgi:hypothetical protein
MSSNGAWVWSCSLYHSAPGLKQAAWTFFGWMTLQPAWVQLSFWLTMMVAGDTTLGPYSLVYSLSTCLNILAEPSRAAFRSLIFAIISRDLIKPAWESVCNSSWSTNYRRDDLEVNAVILFELLQVLLLLVLIQVSLIVILIVITFVPCSTTSVGWTASRTTSSTISVREAVLILVVIVILILNH